MTSVIIEEVIKKVSRPIAAIADGEVYFASLPEDSDDIGYFLNRGTGTGLNSSTRIRTTSGVNVWVDDTLSDAHLMAVTTNTIALCLGSPKIGINGPVILTGEDANGNTIPLTDHQVGHITRLATAVNAPLVIVTNR